MIVQSADGSVGNTDAKPNASQMDDIRKIEDCSSEHILEIAKRVIAETDDDEEMKECSEILLSFLADKKVNGAMLMEYDDEQFFEDIVAFSRDCDSNNDDSSDVDSDDDSSDVDSDDDEFEDLEFASEELLKELKNFDVLKMVKESMEWKKVSVLMDPVYYSYDVLVHLNSYCLLWLDKVSHILPKRMCHFPCIILAHSMKCRRPNKYRLPFCTFITVIFMTFSDFIYHFSNAVARRSASY